jgi:hypothetical protein
MIRIKEDFLTKYLQSITGNYLNMLTILKYHFNFSYKILGIFVADDCGGFHLVLRWQKT